MVNVGKIFEQCVAIEGFNENCHELLDRVMELSSPMMFDDDFASDADLDRLVAELDRFNRRSREADALRRAVESLPAHQTNRFVFI